MGFNSGFKGLNYSALLYIQEDINLVRQSVNQLVTTDVHTKHVFPDNVNFIPKIQPIFFNLVIIVSNRVLRRIFGPKRDKWEGGSGWDYIMRNLMICTAHPILCE